MPLAPKEKKKKKKQERKRSTFTENQLKLLAVSEAFIEKLVDLMFLEDSAFTHFPFALFKTLIQVPCNEVPVLDSMVLLLSRAFLRSSGQKPLRYRDMLIMDEA